MHYFLPLYPAPIANLFRIYSIRDYIRDAARSRTIGVIISFKYGALANPSISSPRSVNLTLFLHLPPRPPFAPLLSFLIIRRFSFLPRALLPPLKPKEGTTYYLRSSRQSWESSASSSFPPPPPHHGFFLLLFYKVHAVLPATPRRLSRTSTRLLQLARLRFPQDNR